MAWFRGFLMQFINEPIFIVGTPRSGTSVLSALLNNHSQIFCGGELHYYDYYDRLLEAGGDGISIFDLYKRFSQFDDQYRIDQLSQEDKRGLKLDSRRSLLQSFMEVQMPNKSLKYWGNSTPRDLFNVPTILKDFPTAKIVVCSRRCDDFMASYKNRHKQTYSSNVERLRDVYHPLTTAILWFLSMRRTQLLLQRYPGNVRRLYYEDLVSSTDLSLRAICEWLRIDYEPKMIETNYSNSSYTHESRGIYASSIGRGAQALNASEKSIANIAEFGLVGGQHEGRKLSLRDIFSAIYYVPGFIVHVLRMSSVTGEYGRNEGYLSYLLRRIFFR